MVDYKIELGSGRKLEFKYKEVSKDKLLIFLPGASGNAMSDRFDYLENIAVKAGFSLARMDYQFQQYKDNSLTLKDCVKDVHTLIEYLKRREINHCNEISIISKSLGALIYQLLDIKVEKGIMLAPYFILKNNDMKYTDKRMDELGSEMYLDNKLLRDTPTLIFHGTKDVVIRAENSENIVKQNHEYKLIKVGSDHGFSEKNIQKIVIDESVKFIKS